MAPILLKGLSLFGYIYSHYSLFLLFSFLLNLRSVLPAVKNVLPYCIDEYKGHPTSKETFLGFENPALIDTILLAAFTLSHSLLARPFVKKMLAGLGNAYRPLYVVQSAFFLHMLVKHWHPIPEGTRTLIWDFSKTPGLMYTIYALAFVWMYTSTFSNYSDIFGLAPLGLPSGTGPMSDNLHSRIVRHAMSLGIIVMLFATPRMTWNHLLFSIGLTIYMNFSIRRLKEVDLVRKYGDNYIAYMQRVPAFCPFTGGISPEKAKKMRLIHTQEVGKMKTEE